MNEEIRGQIVEAIAAHHVLSDEEAGLLLDGYVADVIPPPQNETEAIEAARRVMQSLQETLSRTRPEVRQVVQAMLHEMSRPEGGNRAQRRARR